MQVIQIDASDLIWFKRFNLMQANKFDAFDAPDTGDHGAKSLLSLLKVKK